jgi:FkbM family methyltransferase
MQSTIKQKAVKFLLDIYLFPVKVNNKLKRFAQEVVLIDAAAHLSKPVKYLQIKNLLGKRPVIIDIGGAHGDTTAYFLKLIPNCTVYNFEANPELAFEIKTRFEKLPVHTYSMALSDYEGSIAFHIADNTFNSSYKAISNNDQFQKIKSVEVKTMPLDLVIESENNLNEIDIIKLDVQGAEMDVLRGASNTLQKTKLLIVEQSVNSPYVGGSKYYEIDSYVRDAGFELLDIIIPFRKDGLILTEFDSIYIKKKYIN